MWTKRLTPRQRYGAMACCLCLWMILLAPVAVSETQVHVTRYTWHTGIVVAAEDLADELSFIPEVLGEAPWYEFGWGDAEYYQRGEDNPWLTVPAALWPTESVMHVVAVPRHPTQYFARSDQVALSLTNDEVEGLNLALVDSFGRDGDGEVVPGGAGLYGDSRFFEGEGRFHLRRTCNTWTLEMLAAAGLPVEPSGVIRAGEVMTQLEPLAQ